MDVDNLLKHIFIFLEDKKWHKAEEYCERVIDINPKNAKAYLGLLMVEYRLRKQSELTRCLNNIEENNNYKRLLQYADEELLNELSSYAIERQKNRNVQKEKTKKALRIICVVMVFLIVFIFLDIYAIKPGLKYNKAQELYKKGEYEQARALFLQLGDYKDSDKKQEEIYKRNWVEVSGITVEIPYEIDCVATASGEKICFKSKKPKINEFLSWLDVNANWFVVEDYITQRTSYTGTEGSQSWPIEQLDLYLYDGQWSDSYRKYVFRSYYRNQEGKVPNYCTGVDKSEGGGIRALYVNRPKIVDRYFWSEEMVLRGGKNNSESFKIVVCD